MESSPFTGILITPGLLFVVANSVVMQGLTGRSAGKPCSASRSPAGTASY